MKKDVSIKDVKKWLRKPTTLEVIGLIAIWTTSLITLFAGRVEKTIISTGVANTQSSFSYSSPFTYLMLSALFLAVLFVIYHSINRKINKIQVNPVAVVLATFFLMALWLADLTTLQMSEEGLFSSVFLVPSSSAYVPSLFVWGITLITLFSINYFFIKRRIKLSGKDFSALFTYTQLVGSILFLASAVSLFLIGHDSSIAGFYTLGIYHATLPLIILSLEIEVFTSE